MSRSSSDSGSGQIMSPTPFRLTDDLPSGVTVLEASAGTGKTYAIAGLVTRYVAAGMRLPQLLVVTFTRAATAELRDRVRRRLVGVAAHLDTVLAGGPAGSDDEVAAHLARGDDATVRQRLGHLHRALTEFDAATIATIHGFCQHVLHGVGLASDVERDAEFLEDQAELLDTVVDDVYVRTFRGLGEIEGAPTRSDLRQIAEAVVANPDAVIVPEDPEDRWVGLRVRLAHEIRAEVERRKRGSRLLSYDDLLTRLAATLRDPVRGPAARRRLRDQYRVALVDEFQDTDPIQWEILARTFGDDGSALVLIGDPKQAIYSFRGADVYAYLEAAGRAATRHTLVTNWRSDGSLLDAYNVLFDGAAFGDDRIPYREVAPPDHHRSSRLIGGEGSPLRIRVVTREAEGVRFYGRNRYAFADSAREHLARDLAAEIVTLLRAAPTLVERRPDGSERKDPLRPGDVAVLARTNDEAARVQRALHDVGVPAIIN
ncbi:MAG: UvrD-helicase domain-containing protein, partial [Nitriliruptorales bacterium]